MSILDFLHEHRFLFLAFTVVGGMGTGAWVSEGCLHAHWLTMNYAKDLRRNHRSVVAAEAQGMTDAAWANALRELELYFQLNPDSADGGESLPKTEVGELLIEARAATRMWRMDDLRMCVWRAMERQQADGSRLIAVARMMPLWTTCKSRPPQRL